jgi:hypothetical protein
LGTFSFGSAHSPYGRHHSMAMTPAARKIACRKGSSCNWCPSTGMYLLPSMRAS